MFCAATHLLSKHALSRMALAATPIALAGLVAPMMGAGPWFWRHEPRRVEVVVRPESRPVIVAPVAVDVMPGDLHITAYQTRDTVMLLVTGNNRSGGYTTSLRSLDFRGSSAGVQLCNLAPAGLCTQAIVPFSLSAAMRAEHRLSTVDVRVANQVICVPVIQVQCIS